MVACISKMNSMKKVVITGVGAISVLGLDHASIAHSLYHGISGIIEDKERKDYGYACSLTGSIKNFDATLYLNRKERKTMPDFVQQAYVATMQALEQAKLSKEDIANDETGIIFSNDSTVKSCFELMQIKENTFENTSLGSNHMFKIMNSTISMNLGVLLGIKGGSWTISSACAGGLMAISQAADAIALGRQKMMICGGAQEINKEVVCSFDGLNAFSKSSDITRASCPFDKERSGLVPSGGAAVLILEEEEHAKKRGAKILATIQGSGYSSDGDDLINPTNSRSFIAMQKALESAHLKASAITHINAHATSTQAGDLAEAKSLLKVFGEKMPPVMALKALTGHEFWMAGAAQVVYATIMAQNSFSAGSPSFFEGDEVTSQIPVLQKSISTPPQMLLCNASGFGGSNASVVVEYHV